jgi:hypothetical protein
MLGATLFVITPVAAVVIVLSVWRAWRRRKPGALVAALVALAVEGLAVWGTLSQLEPPVVIDASGVPGIYVSRAYDCRDEMDILPDGEFSRTIVCHGLTRSQRGRWRLFELSSPEPATSIEFMDYSPGCLEVTHKLHSFEQPLCSGESESVFVCKHHSAVAICFGDGFYYDRR